MGERERESVTEIVQHRRLLKCNDECAAEISSQSVEVSREQSSPLAGHTLFTIVMAAIFPSLPTVTLP